MTVQTIEVVHPKRASVSKEELKATLAKKYNVQDDKCIILFGFRVAFGIGVPFLRLAYRWWQIDRFRSDL